MLSLLQLILQLMESKFEKMDEHDDIHSTNAKLYKVSEKHEKLYKLATKKLSDVELDREELSTKIDEANQTIGALRFENNFLVGRTKALMLLSNLNGFNSSLSPQDQRFAQKKGSSKVWKEKGSK